MPYKYNPFTGELDRVGPGSGADPVETITGDSGGAVGPDGAFNINLLGTDTTSVVGNPGTNTLTITPTVAGYPVTPFVVGPSGEAGYATIQAGLNAANAAGGGIVVVQPGDYTENLTLFDACHITGMNFADAGGGVNITGVHTPPTTGGFVFNQVRLISATHIYSSAVAGSAHLVITNAEIFVTNGYTYNVPNWTGKLESFDVNSAVSTNDGFVNNTGGSEVDVFECSAGQGSVNSMIVSGFFLCNAANFYCPVDITSGTTVVDASTFNNAVTFSGDSVGTITTTHFTTTAKILITMTSSGNWDLASVVINDDFSPAIGGAGAGTLTLNNIAFLDNEDIAGTVTLAKGISESGIYYLDNISFDRGSNTLNADGEVWIGSGSGNPAPATLTAGTGIGITNAANSITLAVSATTALSFPTDSGTAVPAANALTISGGTGISTSGAAATVTVTLDTPVAIADGGTNATSFTQGSVLFMGAAAISQDNANLFWDDTTNHLGIGTTTPLDNLEVVGAVDILHTAIESDDHAFEIDCDAAGFGDVKAIDVDYITGAIAAGVEEEALLVNIDETASTGGIVSGYEVIATAEGSATIYGMLTGINIGPVLHNSGTFGNADDILNVAVDVTAALASGGAGAISIFVLDNDTVTVGDAANFGEMEIILSTGSSGSGVAPTFEYSTGGVGFSAFSPTDGTNGFRNTGAILWEPTDLAGWIANATGFFEIRITRTRNSLTTTPIIEELQISATTEFIWDSSGDVNLNSLLLATPLAVAQGGTGVATLTDGGILLGSGTAAITATAQPVDGQVLMGSTGLDPVLATLTGGTGVTITNGAGSISIAADNNGTVTSVSGTVNRISSTGGATPVIDIDSAYVGQATITTLGTITTGVWTGTDVAVADGGSGRSTSTAFAVICGGTTTTTPHQSIASVGTAAQVLTSNGAGALPTFQDAAGGGGTLGTPQATTSGTSFNFSGFSASTRVIHVNFDGVSLSSGAEMRIQIGDAGGIETTGYVGNVAEGGANSDWSGEALIVAAGAAGETLSGTVIITLMNSTTDTWAFTGNIGQTGDGCNTCGGVKSLSDTLTQLTISNNGADTFDAGQVNVFSF